LDNIIKKSQRLKIICPNCNKRRVIRQIGSARILTNVIQGYETWRRCDAGWWVCLDCWYKWDAVANVFPEVEVKFPAGVVARCFEKENYE